MMSWERTGTVEFTLWSRAEDTSLVIMLRNSQMANFSKVTYAQATPLVGLVPGTLGPLTFTALGFPLRSIVVGLT